jgi:NCS1 family nucleobase:cation symporter-1
MSHFQDGQSDSNSSSSRDEESAPLLLSSPSPKFQRARRHSPQTIDNSFDIPPVNLLPTRDQHSNVSYHSSDESYFFDHIMEKVKSTKLAYWANKLAVESEPGLTNAQLMLNNDDLKPGKRDIGGWCFER